MSGPFENTGAGAGLPVKPARPSRRGLAPTEREIRKRDGRVLWRGLALSDRDAVERARASGVVLAGANLRGFDLRQAELDGVDISGADLTGARLTGARLGNAVARGAILQNARLDSVVATGIDLSGARILHASVADGANLSGASLAGAEIIKTNLSTATLDGASLRNARLVEVNLRYASLINTDFGLDAATTADFYKVRFAGACATGAGFERRAILNSVFSVDSSSGAGVPTRLEGANFTGCYLSQVGMARVMGAGIVFDGATLDGVNLSDARLERMSAAPIGDGEASKPARFLKGTSFKLSRLDGAQMPGLEATGTNFGLAFLGPADDGAAASLAGAVLEKSNLDGIDATGLIATGARLVRVTARDADFRRATLSASTLDSVDLSDTDLRDASLAGAAVTGTKFEGTVVSRLVLDGAVLASLDVRRAHFDRASSVGAVLPPEQITFDLFGEPAVEPVLRPPPVARPLVTAPVVAVRAPRSATLVDPIEIQVVIRGANRRAVLWETTELLDRDRFPEKVTREEIAVALKERNEAERALAWWPDDEKLQARLVKATRTYERLRKTYTRREADLRDHALRKSLARAAREKTDKLRGARLARRNLSGADLRTLDLTGADLHESILVGADMGFCKLDFANLRGANLGVNVDDAKKAVLANASLVGADLSLSRCQEVRFDEANLEGAIVRGAYLSDASFWRANVTRADFGPECGTRTNLTKASFEEAIAESACFVEADLRAAVFTRASIHATDFTRARCQYATFTEAVGKRTVFLGAEMQYADVVGAVLARADMRATTLDHIDFSQADLSDSDVTDSRGRSIEAFGTTLPPEESLHEADWQFAGQGRETSVFEIRSFSHPGRILWSGEAEGFSEAVETAVADGVSLGGADLAHADLRGAQLARAHLDGANLRNALLEAADLADASLVGANLEGVVADGASFVRARLQRAVLAHASVDGADFEAADMRGARVYGLMAGEGSVRADEGATRAERVKTTRVPTNFTRADMRSIEGAYADFSGAVMRRARLDLAALSNCRFDRAVLTGASMRSVTFDHIGAWAARCDGVRLSGAVIASNFTGAAMRHARLRGLTFLRSSLSRADLAHADLGQSGASRASVAVGADLSGSNLTCASLTFANLDSARLAGAMLEDADMTGASLGGATLDGARARGVTLDDTVMTAETTLRGADLSEASCRDMRAPGSRFDNVRLEDADVRGAVFTGAVFTGASTAGTSLAGADTTGVVNGPGRAAVKARPLTIVSTGGDELWSGLAESRRDGVEQAAREGCSLAGANLADWDLAGLVVSNLDLTGADLSGADLMEAVMTGCCLDRATLSGARLTGSSMELSRAEGALFDRTDFAGAELSGCALSGASFAGATIAGTAFEDCVMIGADIAGAYADRSSFVLSDLAGASFAPAPGAALAGEVLPGRSILTRASFEGATLAGTDFTGAILTGANLRSAEIDGACFAKTLLSGVDLRDLGTAHADFTGAELGASELGREQFGPAMRPVVELRNHEADTIARIEALTVREAVETAVHRGLDLAGVVLKGENLAGARLDGARFAGANLSKADLSGASLRNADVTDADLKRANLTGVDATGTDLAAARLGLDVTVSMMLDGENVPRPPRISAEPLPPLTARYGNARMAERWRHELYERVNTAYANGLRRAKTPERTARVEEMYALLDGWLRTPSQCSVEFISRNSRRGVEVLLSMASHDVPRLREMLTQGRDENRIEFGKTPRPRLVAAIGG